MPLVKKSVEQNGQPPAPAEINKIAPSLRAAGLVVPIASLTPDPMNAVLHSERNLDAVRESLRRYGQRKTIAVVERDGRQIVMAGNGTLEAAISLGWTEIAAAVDDDLSELDAQGYGMADNRSSDLHQWNAEVVAALGALQAEAGQAMIGFTAEDIVVLRANQEAYQPIQSLDGQQDWQQLWQGMPEFEQGDKTGWGQVVVHFATEADFHDFLLIIDQTPGDVRQNSLWHPRAEVGRFADKRYVAEGGR